MVSGFQQMLSFNFRETKDRISHVSLLSKYCKSCHYVDKKISVCTEVGFQEGRNVTFFETVSVSLIQPIIGKRITHGETRFRVIMVYSSRRT